jgi:hypothetical protein
MSSPPDAVSSVLPSFPNTIYNKGPFELLHFGGIEIYLMD